MPDPSRPRLTGWVAKIEFEEGRDADDAGDTDADRDVSWPRQGRNQIIRRETNKPPRENTPMMASFWSLDNWSDHIIGTGRSRMTTSVAILIAAVETQSVLNAMQWPPRIVLSHAKATGVHWQAKMKKTINQQQMLKTPTVYTEIEKARLMLPKTRRYRNSIEHLIRNSEVTYINSLHHRA